MLLWAHLTQSGIAYLLHIKLATVQVSTLGALNAM
jgi:hypothetical protein